MEVGFVDVVAIYLWQYKLSDDGTGNVKAEVIRKFGKYSAKKEIEATLGTLKIAFEKLLDGLFQETAWDVSSDISVLNTMLAQEGLKEDGLKRK